MILVEVKPPRRAGRAGSLGAPRAVSCSRAPPRNDAGIAVSSHFYVAGKSQALHRESVTFADQSLIPQAN